MKRRRGISTVVGAVFFIMMVALVVSALFVRQIQVQREIAEREQVRREEKLVIVNVTFITYDGVPCLNITVRNEGPRASTVVCVVVENKTWSAARLPRFRAPGGELRFGLWDIGSFCEDWFLAWDVPLAPGEYMVKITTAAGNIFTCTFNATGG